MSAGRVAWHSRPSGAEIGADAPLGLLPLGVAAAATEIVPDELVLSPRTSSAVTVTIATQQPLIGSEASSSSSNVDSKPSAAADSLLREGWQHQISLTVRDSSQC